MTRMEYKVNIESLRKYYGLEMHQSRVISWLFDPEEILNGIGVIRMYGRIDKNK